MKKRLTLNKPIHLVQIPVLMLREREDILVGDGEEKGGPSESARQSIRRSLYGNSSGG